MPQSGFECLIVLKLTNVIPNCQGFKSLLGVGEQTTRKTRNGQKHLVPAKANLVIIDQARTADPWE